MLIAKVVFPRKLTETSTSENRIALGHPHLSWFKNWWEKSFQPRCVLIQVKQCIFSSIKPEIANILRNYKQLSRIKPQVFCINPQVNLRKCTLNPGEIRQQPGIDLQADHKQSQPSYAKGKGPTSNNEPKPLTHPSSDLQLQKRPWSSAACQRKQTVTPEHIWLL